MPSTKRAALESAAAGAGGPPCALRRRSTHRSSSADGPVFRRDRGETARPASACACRTRTGRAPPARYPLARAAAADAEASAGARHPPPARSGRSGRQEDPPDAVTGGWPRRRREATQPLPEAYEIVWSSLGLFSGQVGFSLPRAARAGDGVSVANAPLCAPSTWQGPAFGEHLRDAPWWASGRPHPDRPCDQFEVGRSQRGDHVRGADPGMSSALPRRGARTAPRTGGHLRGGP